MVAFAEHLGFLLLLQSLRHLLSVDFNNYTPTFSIILDVSQCYEGIFLDQDTLVVLFGPPGLWMLMNSLVQFLLFKNAPI